MATHYIGSMWSSKVSAIHFCCKVSTLICKLSAWEVDAGRAGRCLTCTFLFAQIGFDDGHFCVDKAEIWVVMLKPQVWKIIKREHSSIISCVGELKPPCGSGISQYSYAFLLKNILITHFWMPLLKPKPWWTFREDILMQARLMDCCFFFPSTLLLPVSLWTFWIHIHFLSGSYAGRGMNCAISHLICQ